MAMEAKPEACRALAGCVEVKDGGGAPIDFCSRPGDAGFAVSMRAPEQARDRVTRETLDVLGMLRLPRLQVGVEHGVVIGGSTRAACGQSRMAYALQSLGCEGSAWLPLLCKTACYAATHAQAQRLVGAGTPSVCLSTTALPFYRRVVLRACLFAANR